MKTIFDLILLVIVLWLALAGLLSALGLIAGWVVEGVNALHRRIWGPGYCARHARRKPRWS